VERVLALLEQEGELVQPGETVVLKPNLLAPEPPERAVTTHPEVFRAVAEALRRRGACLSYGDSPAVGSMRRAARRAGLDQVAQELGITAADFSSGREVSFPEGVQNKRFTLAAGALAADCLVSLPKLKTHGLMLVTGAVKNQFGCVPGLLKGEFHLRLPQAEQFARMLVDLNRCLRPRLYVMDAVVGMQGNGPRGGQPVQVGALLASTDPVALDAVACRLVGIDPARVPTVAAGHEAGLGVGDLARVELVGDRLEMPARISFAVPARRPPTWLLRPQLRNLLLPRPEIDDAVCIRCGVCVQMCPLRPPAVDWRDAERQSAPEYRYDRCIRCYCCQEVCPEGAVHLRASWLGRLLAGGR
jgi:uncharacterized protein (DUF362 family)/Pyruvate/2-oxoacid:ferredoxin oxidoreductase delta subunit